MNKRPNSRFTLLHQFEVAMINKMLKLIRPINKTAALVTNQSGCEDDISLKYSHVADYSKMAKALHERMAETKDPLELQQIKRTLANLSKLIGEQRKKNKHNMKISVHKCFVQVCYQRMSEQDFNEVMRQAKDMADQLGMK